MKYVKITSILFIICLIIGVLFTPIIKATDEISNSYMRVNLVEYGSYGKTFNIQGYVNGEWQRTTFYNYGYTTFLKVGNNPTTQYLVDDDNVPQNINGVEMNLNTSFINDGRYVKIAMF